MLIEKTGTRPEKEQALHDLDMERLLNRIDPAMDAHRAIVFLHQYLCWDGEEITARSLLLQEFREKSSLSELVDLSRDLAALTEEARKLEQSGDRLHLLLYTGRRMEIYIRAVEKIRFHRSFQRLGYRSPSEPLKRSMKSDRADSHRRGCSI